MVARLTVPAGRRIGPAAVVVWSLVALPPLAVLASAGLALASRAWVIRRASPHVNGGAGVGAGEPWRPGSSHGAAVGVVLGAGLRADGTPTALLARRVEAGVRLYHAGVVGQLVMSGDTETDGRDQPAAMATLARSLGVPDDHLVLDRRGVDTAATCRELRARPELADGGAVVLVTQEFHIHRAVYLARKAGLAATGHATPDAEVRPAALAKARTREIPAAVKAIFVDRP